MSDFFAMGGYAAYVWPCYAVFMVLFIAHIMLPRINKKTILRDVMTQQKRDQIKQQSEASNDTNA